jgi:cytochrome c-type biogenesis protein CcmH
MAVFEQTQAILEKDPDHPAGLTYQALVRVAMGQPDMAEGMLTRAIAKDPDIVDAYIHLALARVQLGNAAGAERAIADAQKRFPQDAADLARVFEQIKAPADGAAAGSGGPPTGPAVPSAGGATSAPAVAGPGITVRLELEPGVTAPPNAVVFVIVREAGVESGPPMAVKRITASAFPMTFTITDADSMAGESLPGLARVEARIDLDGDAASRGPDDPRAAEDPVRPGGAPVVLVLKR